MNYHLDTNTCIYIINRKPVEVLQRFRKAEVNTIFVSSIVVHELDYGVYRSQRKEKNRQQLENFLEPLTILPFDRATAKLAGKIRAELSRNGLIISPMDILIAAHALYENAALVTNNIREFERVPGLKVENWCN